ncbi:hypothetical protein OA867_01735 [Prochlorococcus sp. AH-716-D22]|nr:hypothetical protein [Prochlorococcus sp. AH-716-D22]
MMKDMIKNICLIGFALIGPITLPAGGIQKNLNEYSILNNSKEIILNASCSLYTFPKTNAKKLLVLNTGSSLSILQKWAVSEDDIWARVELVTNRFIEHPNRTKKGWIKI